jgi:hypothetical protein
MVLPKGKTVTLHRTDSTIDSISDCHSKAAFLVKGKLTTKAVGRHFSGTCQPFNPADRNCSLRIANEFREYPGNRLFAAAWHTLILATGPCICDVGLDAMPGSTPWQSPGQSCYDLYGNIRQLG